MVKYKKVKNIDLAPPIRKGTQYIQRTAKELAPVSVGQGVQARPSTRLRGTYQKSDTSGNLRRGIRRKTIGKGKQVVGMVYNKVEYAPHQEFGFTVRRKDGSLTYVPPQPHMFRAMKTHQKAIKELVENHFIKHLQ